MPARTGFFHLWTVLFITQQLEHFTNQCVLHMSENIVIKSHAMIMRL